MYKKIFRPILFRFSPEAIHHFMVDFLRAMRYIPFARAVIRSLFKVRNEKLERELFGLHFANPVGLAAGFDKDAECYDILGDMGFGFVEVGTITPRAQGGNPRPRCFRLFKDRAIINRMGFNNKGVEHAVYNLQRYRRRGLIVGGNIGKNTLTSNDDAAKDYLKAFRALYDYVDYFVVNVSCPNVVGLTSLQSRDSTARILAPLKEFRKGQNEYRPILLKISPDLDNDGVDTMLAVAMEFKLDGIVATNTSTRRDGLTTDRDTITKIANGGLSGSPLTERAIEIVRYIRQKSEGRMPVIGVGGIMNTGDAMRMFEAGASLVQIYSGFIYDGPSLTGDICKQLLKS